MTDNEAMADKAWTIPFSLNDFFSKSSYCSFRYWSYAIFIENIRKNEKQTVRNENVYDIMLRVNLEHDETCIFSQIMSEGSGARLKYQAADLFPEQMVRNLRINLNNID